MIININNIEGQVIRIGNCDIFLTVDRDMFLMLNNQLIPANWELETQIIIEIRDSKRLMAKKDQLIFENWLIDGFVSVFINHD